MAGCRGRSFQNFTRGRILLVGVLPSSSSEGWPKVLSEAMAYGVVPVTSNISSIPQYLQQCGTGRTFEPEAVQSFAGAIASYACQPAVWKAESECGAQAASRFSYSAYLGAVRKLLDLA